MADQHYTEAERLIGAGVAECQAGVGRASTAVLKRALELEQQGGKRVTALAAIRGELRRRGFLRRGAASR